MNLVIPKSKVYHLKITHVRGTVIRGERDGLFDELLRYCAVDVITGQKFDNNIMMKKSYGEQFSVSLLTIESLIKLAGGQVDCPLKPQLGYARSYELESPIYVEAWLSYIPKNGAYKTKKGELVPYKTTDVYRVDMIMHEDDSLELYAQRTRQEWRSLYAEIAGKEWDPQTAGAEDRQILMRVCKLQKIIQRVLTKQELVQLKELLNSLMKD